jgi:hypothetical protein
MTGASMSNNLSPRNAYLQHWTEFVTRHADLLFREPLTDLARHCATFVTGELEGKQSLPFIRFGTTPAKSLCQLSEFTGEGAQWEITINAGLAVNINLTWVVKTLPSPGIRRFVRGLLERMLVRQYVREVEGSTEKSYGGYGPRFCAIANRIGLPRKWRQVIPRRRGPEDANELLGKTWPHCCELDKTPGCYGNDVTQAAIDLALGGASPWGGSRAAAGMVPPILGAWDYVLYLLARNRADEVRRIAATQVDRLRAIRKGGMPVLPHFELGHEDEDGSPIPYEVAFDPMWLKWNDGTIRTLAESIHEFRDYALMPVLADALQDAGCDDGFILRHLNSGRRGHDTRCWVLRGLLAMSTANRTPCAPAATPAACRLL